MKLFKPVSVTHSATLFNIHVIMWIFDFYLSAGWIMNLFDYRHLSAFISCFFVASIQEPNWGYEMILFEQGSAHIPRQLIDRTSRYHRNVNRMDITG
jgi:hypothetical protein